MSRLAFAVFSRRSQPAMQPLRHGPRMAPEAMAHPSACSVGLVVPGAMSVARASGIATKAAQKTRRWHSRRERLIDSPPVNRRRLSYLDWAPGGIGPRSSGTVAELDKDGNPSAHEKQAFITTYSRDKAVGNLPHERHISTTTPVYLPGEDAPHQTLTGGCHAVAALASPLRRPWRREPGRPARGGRAGAALPSSRRRPRMAPRVRFLERLLRHLSAATRRPRRRHPHRPRRVLAEEGRGPEPDVRRPVVHAAHRHRPGQQHGDERGASTSRRCGCRGSPLPKRPVTRSWSRTRRRIGTCRGPWRSSRPVWPRPRRSEPASRGSTTRLPRSASMSAARSWSSTTAIRRSSRSKDPSCSAREHALCRGPRSPQPHLLSERSQPLVPGAGSAGSLGQHLGPLPRFAPSCRRTSSSAQLGGPPPEVLTATEPTELIATDGEPRFASGSGRAALLHQHRERRGPRVRHPGSLRADLRRGSGTLDGGPLDVRPRRLCCPRASSASRSTRPRGTSSPAWPARIRRPTRSPTPAFRRRARFGATTRPSSRATTGTRNSRRSKGPISSTR